VLAAASLRDKRLHSPERPTKDHEAHRTRLRPGTRRPRGRACDWPAEADPMDQGGPLTVHRPARMLPSGFILIRSGSPEKGPLGAAAMRRVAWLKGADRRVPGGFSPRRFRFQLGLLVPARLRCQLGLSLSRDVWSQAGLLIHARRSVPGGTGVSDETSGPRWDWVSDETFGPRWDWVSDETSGPRRDC
jgi:hypothetical protein